jgi:hypothetical protein
MNREDEFLNNIISSGAYSSDHMQEEDFAHLPPV